jgi:predicted Rossmann-fold nucleotide-binding protein
LGIHSKPIGILNINNYFDPLLQMFETGVKEGFISRENASMVLVSDDPEQLLEKLKRFQPRQAPISWLTENEI